MEKKEFVDWLSDKWKYPTKGAELLFNKYLAAAPEIKERLNDLFHAGSCSPFEIRGFSIASLMEGHHMNAIAALFTLDWLLREPEKAEKSLHKGHDFIK